MATSAIYKIATAISAALLFSVCNNGPATEESWQAVKDSAAVWLALTEDWNSWNTPELVISAGNTAGSGDIFFVVTPREQT